VSALGKMHDHKSDSGGQASCEPLESRVGVVMEVELKDGCNDDANQTAEEMSKDQRTRLR
jgi:hypothetical protein